MKYKKFRFRRGFTLVEILVVIGILGLTTSALLYFLVTTVKSSNQTNIIAEVQQNGQVILNTLSSQITNGVSVSPNTSDGGCTQTVNLQTTSTNCLVVQTQGNSPLYIKFFPLVTGTSNGYIATSSDGTNYTSISNQDLVSGVNIMQTGSLPIFSIYSSSGVPASVTINFTLTQAINATSRQDFQAQIPFQTTFTLRSY